MKADKEFESPIKLHPRPIAPYVFLLAALCCVLLVGFLAILSVPRAYVYLFGISGFSIAYAIHFFSISIGLVGAFLRLTENEKDRVQALQGDVEYEIVGCGLWILGGGLGILLSGGILLLAEKTPQLKIVAEVCYLLGAFILAYNVGRYQLGRSRLRAWPGKALRILWAKTPITPIWVQKLASPSKGKTPAASENH